MLTPSPFGHALRKLRVAHHHSQADLAAITGTTAGQVSSIETGKRQPSADFIECIIDRYSLQNGEAAQLWRLAAPTVEIRIGGLEPEARELAHDFAGRLARLSPEQVKAVREIIFQV